MHDGVDEQLPHDLEWILVAVHAACALYHRCPRHVARHPCDGIGEHGSYRAVTGDVVQKPLPVRAGVSHARGGKGHHGDVELWKELLGISAEGQERGERRVRRPSPGCCQPEPIHNGRLIQAGEAPRARLGDSVQVGRY